MRWKQRRDLKSHDNILGHLFLQINMQLCSECHVTITLSILHASLCDWKQQLNVLNFTVGRKMNPPQFIWDTSSIYLGNVLFRNCIKQEHCQHKDFDSPVASRCIIFWSQGSYFIFNILFKFKLGSCSVILIL